MKKNVLFLVTILTSAPYIYGQNNNLQTENWVDKPKISVLADKYDKESAVVVFDKRTVEYVDEAKNEMSEYYTIHKIVHINDDRGIEIFNKIYLGVSENSDITAIKARTILPGGKIIEIDKSNIKDVKEENGNIYKIFAMEGLEKGCEVEYLYTYKKPVSFSGREVLQESVPALQTHFAVIGPKRLKFEIKGYNFSPPIKDTVIDTKRIIGFDVLGIPGLDEEKYAFYKANLQRVEFKLSYNQSQVSGERLFTWNGLAKQVYTIYTYYNEKELKNAAVLVTEKGWDKLSDETAKIITVENYVKNNFSYNENLTSDGADQLASVLKNKIAGQVGMMRLYAAVFQSLGIKYQFVLTGDRSSYIVDKSFENWNNCENPLFYFPAEGKFLAPTKLDYRYPWIDPSWNNADGLFCKSTTLGSFTTAIGEVKYIPQESYDKSYENTDVKMELNAKMDSVTLDNKQTYSGYSAVGYRDIFNYANDEQKRDVIKQMAKSFASSDNILSSEILNQGFDNVDAGHPMVLHIVTKSSELMENAGNKLLVKIGMAIGPQVEMYQEKPRQEPINIEFSQVEERHIEFIIPPGYVITNPDDLKMNQTFLQNGDLSAGFVTDYTIEGNKLKVHIMEQYRSTYYPLSDFEVYKKVINASSDFNKVVLVLTKK
jgi:hypothetical protein